MAGYSQTSLLKKLGIKEGFKIILLNIPVDYFSLLGIGKDEVIMAGENKEADFIHIFTTGKEQYDRMLPDAKRRLKKDGMLWVSWPKKSAKIKTDIDENYIREEGLNCGLVDVKICAVDEKWSGLKFVYRLKDRK